MVTGSCFSWHRLLRRTLVHLNISLQVRCRKVRKNFILFAFIFRVSGFADLRTYCTSVRRNDAQLHYHYWLTIKKAMQYCIALRIFKMSAYLTEAISPLKVSGLFIAKSANTFLSKVIPFSFNL